MHIRTCINYTYVLYIYERYRQEEPYREVLATERGTNQPTNSSGWIYIEGVSTSSPPPAAVAAAAVDQPTIQSVSPLLTKGVYNAAYRRSFVCSKRERSMQNRDRTRGSLSGHVRVSHNVESEEKSVSNASGEAATEPPETIRNADERCRLTHVFVKPTLPLRK
ncbi:hypothetical protein V1477_018281 [Vespula maculifrons]|uniref:Uncharacterized protein n=1 Tax=Vespula maculifrons TaxID=7453 RepID=A0ABD2AZ05_VESMC